MNTIIQPTADNSLADWLAWQESHHPSEIDLGLDRVRQVAQTLGILSPSARIITVAGTNGKGSCIATLEAFLGAAGVQFGAYTSPHLLHYNERVRLQGQPVSDHILCDAFDRINQARGEISLTYFEFGTLAAMLIFNDHSLDYWLLEVGLGGRLDAVNIIDPSIAVITSIALDHEAWLGNTREKIGYEKAGICRADTPLICADSQPPDSVIKRAQQLGCPVKWWQQDFECHTRIVNDSRESRIRLSDGQQFTAHNLKLPEPSVVAALEVCLHEGLLPALPLCSELLDDLTLAGRMQRLKIGDISAILDVAHNPAAASLLAKSLSQHFDTPLTAIVSMMADKDIPAVLQPLIPLVDNWYCVELEGNSRAQKAGILAQQLMDLGVPSEQVIALGSVAAALESHGLNSSGDSPVLVFGSFFTVAEALDCSVKASRR